MFGDSGDRQLRRSVLLGLILDPKVCAGRIGVTAKAGEIILSGYVTSHSQKDAANAAARRIKGVGKVTNRVGVAEPCAVDETAITTENDEVRPPLSLAHSLSRTRARTDEFADARSHDQP